MLAINPQTDDEEETCWDELAESVGAFIMSLPQLASVKMIRRYRQRTLDILLNHCGKQLRCLLLALLEDRHKQDSLLFSTMNLAELLRQKCPLLEELAITILGSQGREQEVRIYTNLGRLTRIRKSHLSLHCSQSLLSSRDLQGLEAYDDMTRTGERSVLQKFQGCSCPSCSRHQIRQINLLHNLDCQNPYGPQLNSYVSTL